MPLKNYLSMFIICCHCKMFNGVIDCIILDNWFKSRKLSYELCILEGFDTRVLYTSSWVNKLKMITSMVKPNEELKIPFRFTVTIEKHFKYTFDLTRFYCIFQSRNIVLHKCYIRTYYYYRAHSFRRSSIRYQSDQW